MGGVGVLRGELCVETVLGLLDGHRRNVDPAGPQSRRADQDEEGFDGLDPAA